MCEKHCCYANMGRHPCNCKTSEAGTSAVIPGSVTKASLLDMFKDHYWDSFEGQHELILKHIESVLDTAKF